MPQSSALFHSIYKFINKNNYIYIAFFNQLIDFIHYLFIIFNFSY